MESQRTLVLGLDLPLASSEEGGRSTPIGGSDGPPRQFFYRPDWALPDAQDGELLAGPVIAFSQPEVKPGDRLRAAILALVPHSFPDWERLDIGAVLAMHEGPRVCGHGTIEWKRRVTLPMTDEDESAVMAWLQGDASDSG